MNEITLVENIDIKSMIYEVRGQLVMLDSDLAKLYECTNGTKEINQAVKNNKEKFPERYSWKLTDDESKFFLVKNFDQKNETRGGRYKNPRVFTEQGVYMIATILKTNKATKTIIAIMDAFVAMKNCLMKNSNILEFKYMNAMLLEHDNRLNALESFIPDIKTFTNQIFYEGQVYDAYSLLLDIFNTSKESIIIIDNYASKELLDILYKTNKDITIYTKNMDDTLINKYTSQYHNITIKINNNFHDRFIIIDKKILYHSGSSFKDLGKKIFAINKIEDNYIIDNFLNRL